MGSDEDTAFQERLKDNSTFFTAQYEEYEEETEYEEYEEEKEYEEYEEETEYEEYEEETEYEEYEEGTENTSKYKDHYINVEKINEETNSNEEYFDSETRSEEKKIFHESSESYEEMDGETSALYKTQDETDLISKNIEENILEYSYASIEDNEDSFDQSNTFEKIKEEYDSEMNMEEEHLHSTQPAQNDTEEFSSDAYIVEDMHDSTLLDYNKISEKSEEYKEETVDTFYEAEVAEVSKSADSDIKDLLSAPIFKPKALHSKAPFTLCNSYYNFFIIVITLLVFFIRC